jgi:hypothetical protein
MKGGDENWVKLMGLAVVCWQEERVGLQAFAGGPYYRKSSVPHTR